VAVNPCHTTEHFPMPLPFLAGPRRPTRTLVAAVPAVLAAAALPSAAEAATARVANGGLTYTVDAGESNVRISGATGKIVIDDLAPIGALDGCSVIAGNAEYRVDVGSVSVALRDR
jgi:hypothetical protein